MASDFLPANGVDEEICLQSELEADRPEPALETSGSGSDDDEFDDNGSGEDEEIFCLHCEVKADRPKPALETSGSESDDDEFDDNGSENEESWLLPTLESDKSDPKRSEPVLEVRLKDEDGTGIGWCVHFSRLTAAFTCNLTIEGKQREVVILVRRLWGGGGPITADMKMGQHKGPFGLKKIGERKRKIIPLFRKETEVNEGVSALKSRLTEKAHEPGKDYNSLKDAYRLMKPTVELPDTAIFYQRTPSGNTVLHLEASYGNHVMVDKVVRHDDGIFMVVNDNYDTALHVAAKTGHGATIKLLLKEFLLFVRCRIGLRGRDHHYILELMLMVSLTLFRNKQGNTFLHEAFMTSSHNGAAIFAAFKAPFIVGQSIHFDEDRYKKIVLDLATFEVNVEGKSLLYLAIETNCEQGVRQLMDSCIDHLQPKGKSPLLAALINNNLGMLETVLSKKQGWIHLRDDQGWLPLHHAVLLGYLQGVLYLVAKCPSCTMERDNNGSLPIHLACKEGHVKIVQELLQYCLDPADMVNDRGQNLLHIACTYRNYELVRYLLEDPKLEMMINQKDINRNTPLHLATISWHAKIVHALTWDKRVDLSVLNHDNLVRI